MKSPVGVALVGIGRWGKQLARVLEARGELVVGCTQTDGVNAAHFRQNYPRARHTTDLARTLADPMVRAVAIATPISSHASLVESALLQGKHVFVEKPLATDVGSARALVALAEARGCVLFVGHVFLYHPAFERLRVLTGNREVSYVAACWRKLGSFDSELLWNLGSHDVALALALFGKSPHEVAVLHQRGLVTQCDEVVFRLGFEAGGECVVNIDRCSPDVQKHVTVQLRDGSVFLWHGQALSRLERDGTTSLLIEAKEGGLEPEVAAFLDACRRGGRPLVDRRHGVEVVEIISKLLAPEHET